MVALQDVEAFALDATRLRAALAADCGLAAALYPRLVEAMSRRLDATRLQLLDLFAGEPRDTWPRTDGSSPNRRGQATSTLGEFHDGHQRRRDRGPVK